MLLNTTESPINRSERAKLNDNWAIIKSAMQTLNAQLLEIKAIDHIEQIAKLREIQNRLETLYVTTEQFNAEQLVLIETAIENSELATQDAVQLVTTINDTKAQIDAISNEVQLLMENVTAATAAASDATVAAQLATDDTLAATAETREIADTLQTLSQQAIEGNVTATDAATRKVDELTQLGNAITEQFSATIDEANNAITAMQAAMQQALNLLSVGEYNAATQYKTNNIVEYDGSSFIALVDNIGTQPPTLPDKSNAQWTLLARRGVDGTGSITTVNGQAPDAAGNVELIIPPSISKWDELEGVPTEFTPAAHTHSWADITDAPTDLTPAEHTHTMADIDGLKEAIDAAGITTMVKERDIYTAAADQTVFTLSQSFMPGSNLLNVTVGGVPQTEGVHFDETDERTFTLREAAPEGELVVAEYFTGYGGLTAMPNASTDQRGFMTAADKQALDAAAQHMADVMPHTFVKDGVTYRYGFTLNEAADGLKFIYEEVI